LVAALFILAGLQYLATEAITALAWKTPPYNYAYNFISDLGETTCGFTLHPKREWRRIDRRGNRLGSRA
jgi:hypothetical protein